MTKKTMIAIGLATALAGTPTLAQTCDAYVGQTIDPKTFDQAIAGLGDVAPKGEFETTAAYEARLANSGNDGPLIIAKDIEDRKYLAYDADNQVLGVKTYALHNMNLSWWNIFYDAKIDSLKADLSNNHAVGISQKDTETGTYKAQNSYGAEATITEITRVSDGIFDRVAKDYREQLFKGNGPDLEGLPLDPASAQALKPKMKAAFVVVPKTPFFVQGEHSVGETTIRNPTDITERYRVLIADIQCGLLTDDQNKVLASYETN